MRGLTKVNAILNAIEDEDDELEALPMESEVASSMVFDDKRKDTIKTQGSIAKAKFMELIDQSR